MRPKKSLGQNFLKDPIVLKKIIQATDLKSDDFVIEVGPGQGVLTEELARQAGKVIAIEIDKNLAELLKQKFKNNKKVDIINKDILKINFPELNTRYQILDTRYKVVANIPYYITSPIIQLFLETTYPPQEMIFMVQKEVAERICASPREITTEGYDVKRISRGKPGEMGILAVSVQYYAQPELLFYVNKKSFYPVPEVDSAVIKITPYSPSPLGWSGWPGGGESEKTKKFFRIVKAGFCAKRKMLVNNLSNSLHLAKSQVEEKLKNSGLNPKSRAQELSVEEWKKMTDLF